FETVFLAPTKESIWDTITKTKEMIDRVHEQKYKNYLLEKVIDHVHDSVIVIDEDERIRYYNQKSESTLDKTAKSVMDHKLLDIFPEMGFISECLRMDQVVYDQVKSINQKNINTSVFPINIEGYLKGALCIFEDVTKLQNLEKKIRFEINKKGLKVKYSFDDIIYASSVMEKIVNKSKLISQNESTVIIYGESGTGKELIAQSIHGHSKRKSEPFVAINCAAISSTLLESELFGYEEGAFTGARKGGKPGLFEIAHGGTIFLDEINSISSEIQSKLLRVIEEKEVMRIGSDYIIPLDVRIIAASNERLLHKVEEGAFRSDLYYRLNTLEINIPPLRDRKEDIMPMFKYFYRLMKGDPNKYKIGKVEEEILMSQNWLGNARELKNVAQRYIMFETLDLAKPQYSSIESIRDLKDVLDLKKVNRIIEKNIIMMLLDQGISKAEVARMLGMSRATLWNKLHSDEDES
ncbi:MAG: sigma 54-interacting transcriptional regulator, partial [Eubacteriales bacterium]|nr:sigma 54-interacting transcriptional regulator [Eubacteriales bacterium]